MLAVLIVCLLTASVTADLMTDKIPNALTITGLTAGLLLVSGRAGPEGLLLGIRDAALMFLMTFLLFRVRALRGGDGKLLCALAAILGIRMGVTILLYSMILAIVIGAGKILWQTMKKERKKNELTRIHYSVPIMLATLICYMNVSQLIF